MVELVRAADSSPKSSDTVPAADATLQFEAEANSTYVVEVVLFYSSTTVADFKVGVTGPAGATGGWGVSLFGSTGISGSPLVALGATFGFGGAGAAAFVPLIAWALVNTTNAGTVSVDWAQNVSEASSTVVRKGSLLRYRKA